jgi:hypothetical protein
MCWQARERIDCDPKAPGLARKFIDKQLGSDRNAPICREIVDDAILVASEIVANAVRAGSAGVTVGLEMHAGELRIEVTDDAAGWPVFLRLGPGEVHGRGLVLIDALAQSWGVERTRSGGKQVWACLLVPREFASSLQCTRSASAEYARESRASELEPMRVS